MRALLISCLFLAFGSAVIANPKLDCKRSAAGLVANPVYPASVEIAALGRTVKLNQNIDLNELSKKELQTLVAELAKRNLLVQVGGSQGFLKSVRYYRLNNYAHVDADVKPLDNEKYPDRIRLMDFQTGKFYPLKIIAAPTELPKTPLFILDTKLDQDFKATGLKDEDRALIETHSRGLMTFSDFLRSPKFKGTAKKNKGTMLLGNDGFFYRKLAEERGYEVFEKVYSKYYEDGTLSNSGEPWDSDTGPQPEVTDRFMGDIGGYDKIFLIPPDFKKQANAYGRKRGGYTWVEWDWLSTHPEEMWDTLFVVGSENTLAPFQKVQVGSTPNRVHLPKLFKDPEAYRLR